MGYEEFLKIPIGITIVALESIYVQEHDALPLGATGELLSKNGYDMLVFWYAPEHRLAVISCYDKWSWMKTNFNRNKLNDFR